MRPKKLVIVLVIFLVRAELSFPQDHSAEIIKAVEWFKEAQVLSEKDNGNLWGIKLYGPMILVDPQTRFIIANKQDNENNLVKNGEVYCGTLPREVNIANTAINWKGEKWTMIISPLPENKIDRTSLMMHELFHRIQEKINLPMRNSICKHLDTKDGRILIRLEWQELITALKADGDERLNHIRNAVILNSYRKSIFPEADSLERLLEMNEGLAEYTGLKLCGASESEAVDFTAKRISVPQNMPTLVRSFAYVSGPLYCLLLDKMNIQWRGNIDKYKSLAEILKSGCFIKIGDDLKAETERIINSGSAAEIAAFENEREAKQSEQLARLKDKFLSKSVLILPLQNMSMQFNPGNLVPLENEGTVYPNIRITDNWGILNVTNEALMSSDFRSVKISLHGNVQDLKNIKSEDWTLELKDGWSFKPAEKNGSFVLTQGN